MTDNIKKINAILDILPQMQCKKCKYDDCESYSRAIVEDGEAVSYTHLRAHETKANLVCRLLLEKKKK